MSQSHAHDDDHHDHDDAEDENTLTIGLIRTGSTPIFSG